MGQTVQSSVWGASVPVWEPAVSISSTNTLTEEKEKSICVFSAGQWAKGRAETKRCHFKHVTKTRFLFRLPGRLYTHWLSHRPLLFVTDLTAAPETCGDNLRGFGDKFQSISCTSLLWAPSHSPKTALFHSSYMSYIIINYKKNLPGENMCGKYLTHWQFTLLENKKYQRK